MACCTVATAAKRAARRCSSATSSVVNELHRNGAGDDAAFHALVQKKTDRLAPTLAVVESPGIHVHADEGVGLSAVEAASKAHCVVERLAAVIEAVGDARAQMPRHFFLELARHVLANHVAAERQRQPRFLQPPGA